MDKKVIVSRPVVGITAMQVCADAEATDEEILAVCNAENPSGTAGGWLEVAREDYKHENARPSVCDDDPNRRHFLVIC